MARLFVAIAVLASLLIPATLAAEPGGPTSSVQRGSVDDGETRSLAYSTNPPGTECLAVYQPRIYTVRLAYAPIDDTLTLQVGTRLDEGRDGRASVSFEANACTAFTIKVTGTDVASSADFVVAVSSTPVLAGGPILA